MPAVASLTRARSVAVLTGVAASPCLSAIAICSSVCRLFLIDPSFRLPPEPSLDGRSSAALKPSMIEVYWPQRELPDVLARSVQRFGLAS